MNNSEHKIEKKFGVGVLFVILAAIIILILTQAYLYGKFLMGSDLLIKLASDKDDLFFKESQSQEVIFKISAGMNPICSAECKYEFHDLSSGETIDSGEFNITPIFPVENKYTLNKVNTGEVQKLALFSVECKAQKARFCYTKGDTVKRTKLITLNYESDEGEEVEIENSAICCLDGICNKCCDDKCSDKNYPIIFLHGHSINKVLPADYSFDALRKIRDQLTKEGYVDAGTMVTSYSKESPGLWGIVDAPIALSASYFFDVYKTADGEEIIVTSKDKSIDTYAIRLRDIISTVQYRTNKDKVIIVAHSMGGLVTRRYVQIFGDSEIEKAIFISVPNHGVDGNIREYCSLLGEGSTCSDMDKDSIFINRLDNSPPPGFPIENIIGFGCEMGGETGDGVVKNSSQFLSYAKNYYMLGACDELRLDFFHQSIADTDKYPQVYEIVNETIRK